MSRALAIVFVIAISGFAAQRPAFDVVSIKSTADVVGPGRPQVSTPRNMFYRRGITVAGLIQFAYGVGYFQIVGLPESIQKQTYVVTAKTETFPTSERMRLMVQSLLADRFKLVVVRGEQDMKFEALTIARTDGRLGPKLQRCEENQDSSSAVPKLIELRRGSTSKAGRCVSMADLAGTISTIVEKPVIDETSLSGLWNYEFTFADTRSVAVRPGVPDAQLSVPSFSVALREDLGLKLLTSKGRVPVLTIISVDPPSAD